MEQALAARPNTLGNYGSVPHKRAMYALATVKRLTLVSRDLVVGASSAYILRMFEVNLTPRNEAQRRRQRHLKEPPRARGERGQAVVEFALVTPVLLTLVFGMIVFGIAFNQYLELTGAASSGAQLLSISRGQTTDPCNTAAQAVYTAAPVLSQTNLTFSFVLNTTTYSGTSCAGAQSNLLAGQNAQVTVTYPCNLKFFGLNPAPNCTLTAQPAARVQ